MTLGIQPRDLGSLLVLIPTLESLNLEFIENYFGARIYAKDGFAEKGLEERWPFVDVLYMRVVKDQNGQKWVRNSCCDCEKIVVSGCTKRLCGCVRCQWKYEELYSGIEMRVEGVTGVVRVMRDWKKLFVEDEGLL